MLGRNLDSYGEHKKTYLKVTEEAHKEFEAKVGSPTVFHKILVDRVADAYIAVLRATEMGEVSAEAKNNASAELTRWLKVSLGELHTASTESQRMLLFYDKVTEIVGKTIADVHAKKELLLQLRTLVEERG